MNRLLLYPLVHHIICTLAIVLTWVFYAVCDDMDFLLATWLTWFDPGCFYSSDWTRSAHLSRAGRLRWSWWCKDTWWCWSSGWWVIVTGDEPSWPRLVRDCYLGDPRPGSNKRADLEAKWTSLSYTRRNTCYNVTSADWWGTQHLSIISTIVSAKHSENPA